LNRLELEMLKLLDFRAFVSHAELQERLTDLCGMKPPPGQEAPTPEAPCKPPAACQEAVGRKRVNEDPSEDASIPAKLQHSSGKDQILVTPALAGCNTSAKVPGMAPKSRAGEGEGLGLKTGGKGLSGCKIQEGALLGGKMGPLSFAVPAAILQTAIDVGGS